MFSTANVAEGSTEKDSTTLMFGILGYACDAVFCR